MTVEFEKRLVAFVDILGWTKATESQSASTLFDALLPLRQHGEFHNEANRQQLLATSGDRVNPLMLKVQYAFFSDCFVFSMPVSMSGRIYSSISTMIYKMLQNGYLLRGGITSGDLFHNDQVVFGKGMTSAYLIESKQAKFARVMVDQSALNVTGVHEHDALMLDHLGNWIVDPFPWIAKADDMQSLLQEFFNPPEIIQILDKNVSALANNVPQRDIWRFQAEVCAKSFEKYGETTHHWVTEFRRIANSI